MSVSNPSIEKSNSSRIYPSSAFTPVDIKEEGEEEEDWGNVDEVERVSPRHNNRRNRKKTSTIIPSDSSISRNLPSFNNDTNLTAHQIEEEEEEDLMSPLKIQRTGKTPESNKNFVEKEGRYQEEEEEGLEENVDGHSLSLILSIFAHLYHSLHVKFDHKRVEELSFSFLPLNHFNSGLAQFLVGMSRFHEGKHALAVESFTSMRNLEPFRNEGLEYLSSSLWHLKRQKELETLGSELKEWNSTSCAQTWIVLGNCFSSQREHDLAIKSFKKAIQLDPSHPYPFTLSGHEFLALDQLDSALNSFKAALSQDPRHFSAYYGLGVVLMRKEEFATALKYFRNALEIHPRHSVLLCYIGITLNSLGRKREALRCLTKSEELDPNNPQVLFQKATILKQGGNWEETYEILLKLILLLPQEASVLQFLGEVEEELGMVHKAILSFNKALSLLPRHHKSIKVITQSLEAIKDRQEEEEDLDQVDEEEYSDMF